MSKCIKCNEAEPVDTYWAMGGVKRHTGCDGQVIENTVSDTPESNAELVRQIESCRILLENLGETEPVSASMLARLFITFGECKKALTTAPEPKKAQTEYMTCDKQFSAKPEPQDRVSNKQLIKEMSDYRKHLMSEYGSSKPPIPRPVAMQLLNTAADLLRQAGQALQKQESGE